MHTTVQTPDTQFSFAAQTLSQLPQCAGSLERSIHEPPHCVVLPSHVELHIPSEQTWSGWHAVSQEPQCIESTAVSTQISPHTVWLGAHPPMPPDPRGANCSGSSEQPRPKPPTPINMIIDVQHMIAQDLICMRSLLRENAHPSPKTTPCGKSNTASERSSLSSLVR